MRLRTVILPTVLLVTLAACDTPNPAEPPKPNHSAVISNGTGVFNQDFTGYVECAGEDVRFVFHVPFTFQVITTPTGTYFKMHFETQDAGGVGTGLTTGTVWNLEGGALTLIQVDEGRGIQQYASMGRWRSASGSTLSEHELLQVRLDGDGNLITSSFDMRVICAGS